MFSLLTCMADAVQYTASDRFRHRPWVCRGSAPISVRPHAHYRLVLDTVGYPLRRFRGTEELLHATYDVFQGMLSILSSGMLCS